MKAKDNIMSMTVKTNSILSYLSTSQFYLKDINEGDLLKIPENERDKELTKHMKVFLGEFAIENGLWELIAQYGMTFPKKNRVEPYFFDACKDEVIEAEFMSWLKTYIDRTIVPIQINELLCRPMTKENNGAKENGYWQYWKDYTFPMIILYADNVPYFIHAKKDYVKAIKMNTNGLSNLFNESLDNFSAFKNNLEALHGVFNAEQYSKFKVFLTSNFRGMHSQTFIKFLKPACNINNQSELSVFIKLCFLIDTAIGSVIYDFDRIINYHEYYSVILKHSTKAAMTAIMSRNISHNIGSHVISYWNTELQERLKSNESTLGKNYSKEEEFIKTSKELFQYIQHRQDFVAELATSIPCSEMSLDLGNDIFGPFISPNEEKYQYKVDSNSEKCISAMLGYIAKSENINMHEQISLKTNALSNTRVSIPNGLVGVHAVYSILENFIRNSAKHCKSSMEKNEEMVRIDVNEVDQLSHKNSEEVVKKWKDDYLAVTLWDWRDQSCEKATIESYMNFLPGGKECDFSDSDGNLKPGGWGIKEMLTSANFLRKKTPEDLYKYINNPEENENEPPLLEAICDEHLNCEKSENCTRSTPDGNYKGKFGIRFYLRKTKDLAVVLNSDKDASGFEFNENGLAMNSLFAIKQFDKYQDYAKEISSYNMVLVENVTENELLDDPTCPCRIIDIKKIESYKIAENGTDGDMRYLELYEEFIKNTFGYEKNSQLPVPYNEQWYIDTLENDQVFSYAENGGNGAFVHHLNAPQHVKKYVLSLLKGEYIQPVSGGYSTKTKLNSIGCLSDKNIQRQVLLELAEAVFVEVIIVDERISDWANKKFTSFKVQDNDDTVFSKLKKDDNQYVVYNKDILNGMKIHAIDVKKENINYIDLAIKLKDWLKPEDSSLGKKNSCAETSIEPPKPARFFVIHQGVLDKLKNEDKDEDKDEDLMNNINCRWQVIDSGRGVPEEEKLDRYPNARFVQISALQKLLENYDKHGLAQTLFSTRRPQFKKGNGNGG